MTSTYTTPENSDVPDEEFKRFQHGKKKQLLAPTPVPGDQKTRFPIQSTDIENFPDTAALESIVCVAVFDTVELVMLATAVFSASMIETAPVMDRTAQTRVLRCKSELTPTRTQSVTKEHSPLSRRINIYFHEHAFEKWRVICKKNVSNMPWLDWDYFVQRLAFGCIKFSSHSRGMHKKY